MTVIINAASLSPGQVLNTVAAKLKAHRAALQELESTYQWISAYAPADFVSEVGMTTDDAQAIFNALTDAHNEYVNNQVGLPATLPATGYKYGNSQKAVIGNG